jgi:uncharacterized repeat protein (TIGR03917 family)
MREEQPPTPSAPSPAPLTAPPGPSRSARPSGPDQPGTVFLQRVDDSSVLVTTQPDPTGRSRLVVLRVLSTMLGTVNAVYLRREEASRLADELIRVAATVIPDAGPTDDRPAATGEQGGTSIPRRVVVAGEGVSAASLRETLTDLPPGARLVDFATDTDVALVFALPPGS